jgi:hypothetical protein
MSVAVTVVPDVPTGTLNVHVNDPVAPVVKEPTVQLELGISTSSTFSPTRLVSEKLVPETVTAAPTGPCVGVTAIAGAITVNVAEAMFVPSDATIVCAPWATTGIATVHEKLPVAFEEQVESADTPFSVKVIDLLAANPVPVAVVVLPTLPLVGLSERNACAVNVTEAMFVPSDAFIACAPFGAAGIVTPHEKPPVAFDEQVEVAGTPSSVKVIDLLAANPVPVAVVVLPTIPLVGLSERNACTVNVAGPLFVPSDAAIVCVPWGTAGIVTPHEKLPVVSDEQVEGAGTPFSVNVIGLPAANPVPVAVVVLPTIPLVGFTENNATTVNVAEAMFVPSDAFIASAPFGAAGIVTPHEKLPVVSDEQVEVAGAPPSVKVIGLLAANPVPVAIVVLPTIPLVRLSERNASTVNVAEEIFVPSDAFIVCAPFGTVGIVTPHEKPPVAFDEQVESAGTLSRVKLIVSDAANPEPVAIVVFPTVPPVGLSARVGSISKEERWPAGPFAGRLENVVVPVANKLAEANTTVARMAQLNHRTESPEW